VPATSQFSRRYSEGNCDSIKLTQERLVNTEPIWVTGATRTGKTAELGRRFCEWMEREREAGERPGVLVLAAIGDNRMDLVDRLTAATQGSIHSTRRHLWGFFRMR
jgi:hypothetical protein